MTIRLQKSTVQLLCQFRRPYLSHRLHSAVTYTIRTQIYKLNINNNIYDFKQYTVDTRNTNTTHERMPTRSKTTRQQCALPPGPALDLGSSLLTPTVVVALALGTSSPRPERTPLTRQPAAIFRTGSSVDYRRHLVYTETDIHAIKAYSTYRLTPMCSLPSLT